LVVDVQIFEYAKKEISFRETKDGIVIKNKKFIFDDLPLETEMLIETNNKLNDNFIKEEPQKPQIEKPKVLNHKKPLRWEFFDPFDKPLLEAAKSANLLFTPKKKYPIFQEKIATKFEDGILYL